MDSVFNAERPDGVLKDLDLRGGCGNMELVDELRLFLFESLEVWTRFFRILPSMPWVSRPP